MSSQDPNWMIQLHELLPDWDGEGAPVPSKEAINKTKDIVGWATLNNLNIDSIDPDVLGGVSIYLTGIGNRTAWIAILNHENSTIVVRVNGLARGYVLDIVSLEELKLYLTTE